MYSFTPHRLTARVDNPSTPPPQPGRLPSGVTAVGAYRAYFLPATTVQWFNCIVCLHGQAGQLPTSSLRNLDVTARTHMTRYLFQHQDPTALTEAVRQALTTPPHHAEVDAPPPPHPVMPVTHKTHSRSENEICLRYNYSGRSCPPRGTCGRRHICHCCHGQHPAKHCGPPPQRPPEPPPHLAPLCPTPTVTARQPRWQLRIAS